MCISCDISFVLEHGDTRINQNTEILYAHQSEHGDTHINRNRDMRINRNMEIHVRVSIGTRRNNDYS